MVRILYFYKVEYILQRRTNETFRYGYKLMINMVAIIFLSTSFILEVENQSYREANSYNKVSSSGAPKSISQEFQFHDMLYYMLVTLGTIGYGDITPKTTLARFAIIVTIGAMLVIVPTLSQKLITVLALTSKYSRISYRKFSKDSKHLLLLGSCGVEGFEAFLQELYHEDHGIVDYETVIMQNAPSEDLMFLIRQSISSNNIFYLVGNSLIHKDLERCKASSAVCVVLLANKLAKNPRHEDFSNILQAFSVKKFARIYSGKDVRICIQLLRPETKEMYFSSLINNDEYNSKDQIICVEEIKLMLLGKSCLCPGINTIISSLITSRKPSLEESDLLLEEMKWLNEYLGGMQNEIYRIKLEKDIIQGIKLNKLIKYIYEISGLTVIGVDVMIDGLEPFVCINPSNYYFSENDHVIYVLADKMPESTIINTELREKMKMEERDTNLELAKFIKIRNKNLEEMEINGSDRNFNYGNNYNFSLKQNKNKKKLNVFSRIINPEKNYFPKNSFLQTSYPRTNHELENFSSEILNSHIIICGIVQNMKNLLMPLRAFSMKNQQFPILIIDKEDHISSNILKDIQYFPDIYYMQGNLIKSKDLHRACIKRAKAVIILSKNRYNDDRHEMVDADTIFIYKAIRNENKNVLIIADLASISTIGFISSNDDMNYQKQGYRLSEQFAVGEIYTSSMLDTLMCQSFYNPYILSILQQFILGSAGSNYPQEVLKKLEDNKITQSTLYLLNIFEEFDKFGLKDLPKKMSYGTIFSKFAEKNMVPIGIYRNSKISDSRNSKTEKYVFMCPPKNTDVWIEHDRIYILASDEEGPENKPIYKNREVSNFNKNNLKLIQQSNDLATQVLQNIKSSVDFSRLNLKNNLSVKKITDLTRLSIRRELIFMHDKFSGV